ncbi:ABC-2 transporter permease [Lachnospiraceae bacterium 46-15]
MRTLEQIGVVFDGSNYPEILSPRKLNRVMKNIYRTWDERVYFGLLKRFSLQSDKQIKRFSKGMKMKLAISAAFSHHSRLLILNEATSVLDPVARDDILDMLLDFVQDEEHSILVASHITSDAASKWNKNVITMPVPRNQIIGEKFLFYILLAVLGLLTALIPCVVLACFGTDITLHSLLLYGSIGISAMLLAGGISLPCAYLFDPEKSQIVFMMSFMAGAGIITGLVLLINLVFL